MYVEIRPFKCRQCAAVFRLETLQDVLVDVWITHIKTLRCPKCGSGWRRLAFISDRVALELELESESAPWEPLLPRAEIPEPSPEVTDD